jgi:NADH-quinone oxidoreductase subunit M
MLRVFLPVFPEVLPSLAPLLSWLAVATVLLGAVAALAQTDLKRMLAYSSVNHLGYCALAIAAAAAGRSDRAACLRAFRHGAASLQPRHHRLHPVLRHRHAGNPQPAASAD